MTRSHWHGWAWAGFLAGMIGPSFLGCYGSLKAQQGSCEDDSNPCTIDTCDANGTSVHTPVSNADMTQCFLGENEGVCLDGSCELNCLTSMTPCKCSAKSDCPTDTFCATWACTMGQCVSTPQMEGMTADPLQPGDCQKRVCQGGSLKVVDDPMDTPTDVKGDCQAPVCNAGVPGTMTNDTDVPAMDDMPGDCKKPVCNGGTLGTTPDIMDVPAAKDCTTYGCNPDGTASVANAKVGTACSPMMNMVCDKLGMCVGCLDKPDWDNCNMPPGSCIVSKCEGQSCTSKAECVNECADGVCCNTTCTEECKSCAVPGMVGTCTNIPSYQEDNNYGQGLTCDIVTAGSVCNGNGKCLRTANTPCTMDTQCFSAKCSFMKCLGAPGEICSSNAQCISLMCVMGACK